MGWSLAQLSKDWETFAKDSKNLVGVETTRQAEERRAALKADETAIFRDLVRNGVPEEEARKLSEHWRKEADRQRAMRIGVWSGITKFRENMASTGVALGAVCMGVAAALQVIPGIGTIAGVVVGLAGLALTTHGKYEEQKFREEIQRRRELTRKLGDAKNSGQIDQAERAARAFVEAGGDPEIAAAIAARVDNGDIQQLLEGWRDLEETARNAAREAIEADKAAQAETEAAARRAADALRTERESAAVRVDADNQRQANSGNVLALQAATSENNGAGALLALAALWGM